jgi:Protein of unknown function (DUF3276)
MDNHKEGNDARMNDTVYSQKLKAGKRRTYFFDVRTTRGNDYYITITESTKRNDDEGYNRHKIFLYKEDFNEFLSMMNETVNHVKNELMPDYDYDEFAKRRAEAQRKWEEQKNAGGSNSSSTTDEHHHDDEEKW